MSRSEMWTDEMIERVERLEAEVARLRAGIEAYIEAQQLDREDIRDLCALLASPSGSEGT